jgi:lipopolysaccharide transport protein LptA
MRLKYILTFALGVFLFVGFSSFAADKTKVKHDKQSKVTIESDFLEVDNNKKTVEFTNNVRATTEDFELFCKRLLLYAKSKNSKSESEKNWEIDKIIAEGNVIIKRSPEETLEAGKAVFLMGEQKIELTENPKLKKGTDEVRGEKMEVFLKENRVKIFSGDNQKVRAVVKSVNLPENIKEGR